MAPGKACCISLRTGVLITGFINLAFITFLFWGVFQDFGEYMTDDDTAVAPGSVAFQIISVTCVFGACLLQIIGGGKNHACSLRWSFYLGITFLVVSMAIVICVIAVFGVATSESAQYAETTQLVQLVLMFALLQMIPIAILIFAFEILNLVLVRALYQKIEYEAPELLINDKDSMTI